ncbi:hypothetical protein SAMN05660845_1295 [Flavobacterium swingsii]|jgi:hypothetical protein|uniref:Uncharacterized protein n=1 Tax=Flavobacterium swingsii TaxID=498292 RepID=A0A1I0XMA2_9FLAO|nr:hypothetical protein [Flavobacterium swingsii]SFB01103.1 hypothetical protein SAMN05660845_1295 [Flavobacterium swingsii]
MIRHIQNLDTQTKYSLLITTFALALFVMFVLNVAISIIYMLDLIKQPDFETISMSVRDGYYTLNGKKIGAPIFFNIIAFFLAWFLMTCHTIKSIYELDFFLDDFNSI